MTFFRGGDPRVFAHRGGRALGPENTLIGFDRGLACGADGLELDVHLSADGQVVVCHDATLDRTTDATGPVAARTADELARVDAGYRWTDAAGRHACRGHGIGVPTLREVLRRYPDVPVIIEMKPNRAEVGLAVAAEVAAAGAAERVCAAGDGGRAVQAVRAALPRMATSACRWDVRVALYRSWVRWPVHRTAYGGYQVPETAGVTRIVSPRFVGDAHRAGLEVQVWTVNEESDMERLLGWGVDALISDRPDVAVRLRDRLLARRRAAATEGGLP